MPVSLRLDVRSRADMTGMRVGIVGAGIIGASCALTLARQGHQVFLLEPETPGGPHGASHGNGGWISPASIIPMATPGLWKKIPGYLLDPMGPLTLRPTSLPHLLPWLWQFLRAGSTVQRVRNTTTALHQLKQRLSHQRTGNAKMVGEFLFGQLGAGVETMLDNGTRQRGHNHAGGRVV